MESIVLGIYLCFKIYFLTDTNAKMWTEIIDLVILGRNYWSSCRVLMGVKDSSPRLCVPSRQERVLRFLLNQLTVLLNVLLKDIDQIKNWLNLRALDRCLSMVNKY